MVRAANERTRLFYVASAAWALGSIWLIARGLGVVAFVGWILWGIWHYGLRDKFSNEETASAYSVFNQNGKGIVGGFTAQQFDSQIRGRPTGDETDNPIRGSVAVAFSNTNETHPIIDDKAKLRKRKAAAAAAERRLLAQGNETRLGEPR